MKKLVIVLFLLAGLSNFSSAQIFSRHDRSEAKTSKQVKPVKVRKQMSHFEKQKKDVNIAHNGAKRKTEKYNVAKVSFKAINPVRNERWFTSSARSERKAYEARLTQIVYSRKRPRSHFTI